MLVTAILGNTGSALTLSSPASGMQGESFTITLDHNDSQTYDVKIVVQAGELSNLSKNIVEGKEKSSFYYLKEAFPAQKEFTIKIVQVADDAELCVRLRLSGKSTFREACNPLVLTRASESETRKEETTKTTEKKEEKETKEKKREEIKEISSSESNTSQVQQKLSENSITLSEPLLLTKPQRYQAPFSGTLWKVTFFSLFCTILLLLILFRKI
jgi:alpha-L-arabinofuranosidase